MRKWPLFRCASDRRCTRCFAWQAQYFVMVWPGPKELKVSSFLGAQANTARFAWHFPYVGLSWLATFRLTRRIVWQAQYFVTVWPGRKELKVSSFLGAQVNTARFAWHLQYAGTFDWWRNWKCLAFWVRKGTRLVLHGIYSMLGLSWLATFRLTRRIVWQAQYFVTVWPKG